MSLLSVITSPIIMSVVMLSVVRLNVVMLSVVAPKKMTERLNKQNFSRN
jgi:hypothetical protein